MRIIFNRPARVRLRDLILSLSAANQARINYIEVSPAEFNELLQAWNEPSMEDPLNQDNMSLISPLALRFRGITIRQTKE
jgi:hypothetical protein